MAIEVTNSFIQQKTRKGGKFNLLILVVLLRPGRTLSNPPREGGEVADAETQQEFVIRYTVSDLPHLDIH